MFVNIGFYNNGRGGIVRNTDEMKYFASEVEKKLQYLRCLIIIFIIV